nr:hypothetical protein [Streptomyces sp. S1D4-11]
MYVVVVEADQQRAAPAVDIAEPRPSSADPDDPSSSEAHVHPAVALDLHVCDQHVNGCR